MSPLYHLIVPRDWEEAQRAGLYAPPSLASQGFVHLSGAAQVLATAERFYRDADALLLLVLDPGDDAALRWEEGEPGELFPHLYRPVAMHEVLEVEALIREGGRWSRRAWAK